MLFGYFSLMNSFPKWPATLFWTTFPGPRTHQVRLSCTHTLIDILAHSFLRFQSGCHFYEGEAHHSPSRHTQEPLHGEGDKVLNASPQPPELVNFTKHPGRHVQDRASEGRPLRKRSSPSFKVTLDLESVLLCPEQVTVKGAL